MISVRINEYAIKKHFFTVFVCLLLSATAWIFLQGDRIFLKMLGVPSMYEDANVYANEEFRFSVSYPKTYLVGEEVSDNALSVYFTGEQEPLFRLKHSPIVFVASGNRVSYIEEIRSRKNTNVLAMRNVTAGDGFFAKEVTSSVQGPATEFLKETVWSRSGVVYVILQRYAKNIDPAYPLLVQTFQFR